MAEGDPHKKQAEEQKKRAEEQLKAVLRIALENDAYDRMINVQHANPQLFLAAAQNIVGFYKQTNRKLTDNEVLQLLQRIKQMNETETTIRFQRK
ncbi:MAG TPA: DNA-binding protein [Candidatus Bilamarchaeaceae archaeon]|nr:DNA-binding protein [Candidatus Bilamarchaeaceae archaeon]